MNIHTINEGHKERKKSSENVKNTKETENER